MECPHCQFSQPEGVECAHCHMPLGEFADLLRGLNLEVPRGGLGVADGGDLSDIPLAPGEGEEGQSPQPDLGQADGPGRDELAEQVQRVRLTTAPGFSGLIIRAYRGLVSAQVLVRMDGSLAERLTRSPVVSLRTSGMGDDLNQALSVATGELRLAVVKVGGNAVISVSIAYQSGFSNGMLLALSGTAVEVVRERRA